MSKEKLFTFEEADAHLKAHFTPEHQQALESSLNLCGIYGSIKPALVFASNFWLLPLKG